MKPTSPDFSQFLIIDDDPGIAKFLVTYLRQRGHTCDSLTDGFQTAAWLAHHDSDVVIVDLKMPKVDGMEVLRAIKADSRTKAVPVVIMTSSKQQRDLVESYHSGVNSYIQKPINFGEFQQVIGQLGYYWLAVNQSAPPGAFK